RCKFFSLTETPEDYTIIVDEEGFLGSGVCAHCTVGHGPVPRLSPTQLWAFQEDRASWGPLMSLVMGGPLGARCSWDPMLTRWTGQLLFSVMAAQNLGITNGFVKPKMVQRSVIHPLSSPSNRFCVTSLDPDTLPTVATLLMDVMFYSNG
ncbi:GATS-like protein 1, partial [Heterocephalus glaber]